MGAMVSQICSTVCSGADQRKHQSSVSLAFVWGATWWPVYSPHKGPITRKIFPFDDVIVTTKWYHDSHKTNHNKTVRIFCRIYSFTGCFITTFLTRFPYLFQNVCRWWWSKQATPSSNWSLKIWKPKKHLSNTSLVSNLSTLLTYWGRVTHICVGVTIIVSDNGLSPSRRQAITWTNARILLIGPLGTNFSEILIGIQTFSFMKMHLKMSSAKWRPFCLGPNVLTHRGPNDAYIHKASIASDNGFSPIRHQAIIWTCTGPLLTGPLAIISSEILIKI